MDSNSGTDMDMRKKTGNGPRCLVIEGTDTKRPLSSLSPFAIAKGIKGLSEEPMSTKRLKNGSFLVKVSKEIHATMLLKWTMLITSPIKVSDHKTLNSTREVTRCHELKGMSDLDIQKELEPQGVTHVKRMPFKKGGKKESHRTQSLWPSAVHHYRECESGISQGGYYPVCPITSHILSMSRIQPHKGQIPWTRDMRNMLQGSPHWQIHRSSQMCELRRRPHLIQQDMAPIPL